MEAVNIADVYEARAKAHIENEFTSRAIGNAIIDAISIKSPVAEIHSHGLLSVEGTKSFDHFKRAVAEEYPQIVAIEQPSEGRLHMWLEKPTILRRAQQFLCG